MPDDCRPVPAKTANGPWFSVAELYKQIAADMRNYSQLGRSFDTGVRRHPKVAAIEKAVAAGRR